MKVTLHILRKDLRRHWPEIFASILVAAGWAWQQAHPDPWIQNHASAVFPILLFVLWFILTVRAVQGESLVGDREFWQTRPYCWWQLMFAKAILLIISINGVFGLAQVYLLMASGIPFRSSWIAGLVWLHLEYDVYFILPAVAFAVITPSIVQWVLTLIGVCVTYFVVSWLPWYRLPATLSSTENLATVLGVTVTCGMLLVVVVWQYARRNVWRSRILTALAVLTVPLWFVFAATTSARNLAYPKSAAEPLTLAIAKDGGVPHYTRVKAFHSSTIYVPVVALGLRQDSIVVLEGVRFHLAGDGGWHWDSSWMNQGMTFSPDSNPHDLILSLDDEVADKLQTGHATATLELALALYRLDPPQVVETGSQGFVIPGVAACHWLNPRSFDCKAAFRTPDVTVTRLESSSSTCGEALPPGHSAINTQFDQSPFPADFNIDPVKKIVSDYGIVWDPPIPNPQNPKQLESASLCQGMPVTVRSGSLERRMRISSAIGSLGQEIEKPAFSGDQTVSFGPRYE